MVKEEITKHIDRLPGFSMTVAKVMHLSNDLRASPKDLIHAISLDPVLTAEVLRLINSAYFGMKQEVVSLNRAVILLGVNTIKNVALGSAVIGSMKMRNNFRFFTSDQFWEHSLGVAVGSKTVAARLGVPAQERDEYFIAGLLHDIGKVIFVQHLPDEYARLSDPAYRPGVAKSEVEEKFMGVSHTELGMLIAKKWELPEQLRETIAEHHSPKFGRPNDQVKAAVHLTDWYCNRAEIGIKGRAGMEMLSPEVWDILKISENGVDDVFKDLGKSVEDAKVFLKN
ncbi:MAG: HDOD domain-containing protein [Nitrospinae bacterium]|nr:HDOD domain-containing protein [Nitrospinota bacterium]